MKKGIPKVTVDKNNVSPVLKQILTFKLSDNYYDTLKASDLSVQITGAKGYKRYLYVISANDSDKTFTVKFNGAPVGSYKFTIKSTSVSKYAKIDSSDITFETSSNVTSITPISGSVYGGTLLTITGTNFSNIISD